MCKPMSSNPMEKLWDFIESNITLDQVHNVEELGNRLRIHWTRLACRDSRHLSTRHGLALVQMRQCRRSQSAKLLWRRVGWSLGPPYPVGQKISS